MEHAGEVVKKRELIQRVWPEIIVEEGTLRVHISALRKALGDGQSGMRYVENITGVGYRFVAPVHLVEQAAPAQLEHTETAEPAYNIEDAEIERFTVAPLLAFVHVDATSWDFPRQLLRLNELADVWEIHRVAGESAIILKVQTRDAHSLEALLDGIHTIDGLRSTRTYIVLSTYRDSGSNLAAE